MQKEKLYSDSKKEALYEQLLTSLEERGKKIHVIYVNSGETKKEAEKRYCAETGSFIGASDIVLLVVYGESKSEDSTLME